MLCLFIVQVSGKRVCNILRLSNLGNQAAQLSETQLDLHGQEGTQMIGGAIRAWEISANRALICIDRV
jgi:hypothetical protein